MGKQIGKNKYFLKFGAHGQLNGIVEFITVRRSNLHPINWKIVQTLEPRAEKANLSPWCFGD